MKTSDSGFIPNLIFYPFTGNSNLKYSAIWMILVLFSCRPLVTTFDDIQDAVTFTAASKTDEPDSVNSLKVMTWNIRFGAGRIPFFGDSCGDRGLMTESETIGYLNSIVAYINLTLPKSKIFSDVQIINTVCIVLLLIRTILIK